LDLAIGGDAAKSVPLLLDEVRSTMTSDQRARCAERSERLQAEGRRRYADLDLLAMNPHLRRDIGADNLRDAGFGTGDIWRK